MKKFSFFFMLICSIDVFSVEEMNLKPTPEESKSLSVPELFPVKEVKPTFTTNWKGSCYSPVAEHYFDELRSLQATDIYFPFSLKEVFEGSESKGRSLNFYKTEKFTGTPDYVLDQDGLKESGKLICKWNLPYSELNIYKNYLPDCAEKKHQFLGFTQRIDKQGIDWACSVVNVKKIVKENEIYSYIIDIGGSDYFLDVSNIPLLKTGKILSTSQKRGLELYEEKISRRYNHAKNLISIKESESFKRLQKCYVENDGSCVVEHLTENFLKDVANRSGGICQSGKIIGPPRTPCNESHRKAILEESMKLVKEYIDIVNALKADNVSLIMFDKNATNVDKKNYRIFMNPFGDERSFSSSFTDGVILFETFDDGMDC